MPSKAISAERARELQALGAEAKRRKREEARALMIEKLAEKMAKAVAVVDDAMDASGGYTNQKGEWVDTGADHRTRLAAADRVFDRVVGRASQELEVTGAGGGPVEIVLRSAFAGDDDRGGSAVPGEPAAERASEGVA